MQAPTPRKAAAAADTPFLRQARLEMVERQLEARGITDARVLAAMRAVPRHAFVDGSYGDLAYADTPLPIGRGQTISQPYIVAAMIALAHVSAGDRVLEIGAGSGYQAAVLAALGADVYAIEIVPALARAATERLRGLGFAVNVRCGDGYAGWPEAAPFDAILVAAAAPAVPPPLCAQLAIGGRMVIPVGKDAQDLRVITRTADGFLDRVALPVDFVPMTGLAQRTPAGVGGSSDAR